MFNAKSTSSTFRGRDVCGVMRLPASRDRSNVRIQGVRSSPNTAAAVRSELITLWPFAARCFDHTANERFSKLTEFSPVIYSLPVKDLRT